MSSTRGCSVSRPEAPDCLTQGPRLLYLQEALYSQVPQIQLSHNILMELCNCAKRDPLEKGASMPKVKLWLLFSVKRNPIATKPRQHSSKNSFSSSHIVNINNSVAYALKYESHSSLSIPLKQDPQSRDAN
ncbi:hypothetical protein DPMN_033327 [Dreissena polymorpha]|uniref:Uncharacterized protein n=1 Tax=Dreissena polymorpha TaxID=45954 RepID=A0A9D4M5F7_DREPO|nr:hypothetical protein DPMN_033327 [Dreissena polymorpha]